MNDKCSNALSMLGELELKNDDWVRAKETFRAAGEATDGKDSYATLSLVSYFSLCTFILVVKYYYLVSKKGLPMCHVSGSRVFASHIVLGYIKLLECYWCFRVTFTIVLFISH